MGRHVPVRRSRHVPAVLRSPRTLSGLAVLTVLGLVALLWAGSTSEDQAAPPVTASAACRVDDTVRVTVAPEAGALVQHLLAGQLPVEGGGCTVAEVRTEEPRETLETLTESDLSAQPQIWVPDDVSWAARAGETVSSMGPVLARTPLVLVTSRVVAEELGWTAAPPTWTQALGSPAGVTLPDPVADSEGLLTIAALQNSTVADEAGRAAITQAVLSAGSSGKVPVRTAVAEAVAGSADAPIAVLTEQQVAVATQDGPGELVTVVPVGGTPVAELPVLRMTAGTDDASAVDAVLARLSGAASDGADVRAAGWRDAADRRSDDVAAPPRMTLDPATVAALPELLAGLATPGRLLVAVDVSASMAEPANGGNRAELARDALTSVLTVLSDRTTVAVWGFSHELVGEQDWQEILPARLLGAEVDGRTQREVVEDAYESLPDRLAPGGTGLYDTTLAAIRAARDAYDPAAVNVVVLLTDGEDDDDDGISEEQLLSTLTAETDPARPVQLVAVGLGPDADVPALERIAAATGGRAFLTQTPADLQAALLEARRSALEAASR
jgi:Ca-activated chloride channel family protein